MKGTGGSGGAAGGEEAGIALVGVHSDYPRYTEERNLAGGHLCKGNSLGSSSNLNMSGKSKPNVGYRLGRRKALFEKRKRISDYALVMVYQNTSRQYKTHPSHIHPFSHVLFFLHTPIHPSMSCSSLSPPPSFLPCPVLTSPHGLHPFSNKPIEALNNVACTKLPNLPELTKIRPYNNSSQTSLISSLPASILPPMSCSWRSNDGPNDADRSDAETREIFKRTPRGVGLFSVHQLRDFPDN
ncbi:hypothetical protein M8J76_001551 [Diaphorina citri]|nr:hypothetical protein M8J76_001551 [Diaphorina citri]